MAAYTNDPKGFRFEFSTAGGYPTLHEGLVQTNTSIAAGDALIWLTTGYLSIALSTSPLIAGVAAHAITGAAGVYPKLRFYPAVDTNVFSIQATTTTNVTQSLIGTYRSIEFGTGAMGLDMGDADPGVCNIIGFKRGYTVGTYPHMLVVFKKSQFVGQTT